MVGVSKGHGMTGYGVPPGICVDQVPEALDGFFSRLLGEEARLGVHLSVTEQSGGLEVIFRRTQPAQRLVAISLKTHG